MRSVSFIPQRAEAQSWVTLRLCAFALFSALFLTALWTERSQAHEPITTKVRFNKEVVRILARNCFSCHKPGGFAPWSLLTYEEARPWAKAIKEEMLEKRMPVWHAVKGYGEFRNVPELTQREVDLIVNWVEGGAPKGEDKDLPARPLYSNDWPLGKPDLTLKLAEQRIAADSDETRTFALATNLKEDRWLTAIDLLPTNNAVVYSTTFYLQKGESQKPANSKPMRGKPSPVPHLSSSVLATWVPGQRVVHLPEGVGQMIPAGSRIVAEVRYRGTSEAAKDQSAIGLYFAATPPLKQAREVAITDSQALIPVSAALQPVKATLQLTEDTEAIAIRPRVHGLIVSLQAMVTRPDGSEEVLIWTQGHRYDWQQTYYFKRPIALPKDTRIEVLAYFDNSEANPKNPNSPAQPVRWSALSQQPLCALLLASPRSNGEPAGMR